MGGMPFLSTLIKQQRKQVDTSFLFDAGDIYTGALSEKSTGKLPFDLYSAMGYDAVNLGNHEFEYGWKSLVETKPRASFPVLSANIFYKDSGTLIADPYTILEKDGVRIGVVGVMGVDAFHNATATFQHEELYIKPPTPIVQYWVDKIKDDVHMVVVLTHQNKTAPMQTNKESDPSVQRGFEEDYAMAGELRDVDVIFGGHSDNGLLEPVVHPKTGIVIGLTFGQGMHLGYLKFLVSTSKKESRYIEGGLIPVNAGVLAEDKKVSSLFQKQRDIYPSLIEEFAYLKEGALRKYNEESDVGNLLTDIMRAEAGSDIAMINSGAIRADLNAGPVTREHIQNVYPFIDNLTTVRPTGKQVRELIRI